MKLWKFSRPALVSVAAAALLAACGGGSSPQEPMSAVVGAQDTLGNPQAASIAPAAPASTDDGRKPARSAPAKVTNNIWIVQLSEPPVTSYTGGVGGLAATKPAKGQKINRRSTAVVSYMGYLTRKHDAALASAGGGKKIYDFGYVFNGFAAELSEAQAQQLRTVKGVRSVTRDSLLRMHTASTPGFVGLAGTDGVWNKTGAKGDNIVIGVIDSGVWPENNSFAEMVDANGKPDHAGTTSAYSAPANWSGTCVTGTQFTVANCNNKLIGARYYNAAWGGDAGITSYFPYEYLSPRDWGGHGTHTSSTAGGNAGVTVTGPAAGMGTISGMAPRARIAMYKVCWSTTELGGGCFASDSMAGIEQSIADGVDVINFSIGGSQSTFLHPTEFAFLEAAASGVFVAASAGNDGPDASTVEHPSPWITTVAAGTHNRSGTGSVTINGNTFNGASFATAVSAPIIKAADAAVAGANADMVRFCYAAVDNGGVAVLDSAKVAGKVVLCERGATATVAANARVNKSLAVSEAGGVGMVLVNIAANSTNADVHSVPTVHLDVSQHDAVFAASAGGPTASIAQSTLVANLPAPLLASFSSRGPTLAAGGNLLKPDIVAPGQDVLAAVAPPDHGGRMFDLNSGTSMASPHIAGIAAVYKQIYPSWSPMMIKSALMTTAYDVLDGPASNTTVAFGQGAGHVNAKAALDPGLVFDSDVIDWLGFLCGVGEAIYDCAAYNIPVLDPSNLNVPSIALGGLAGSQTVTRRVTNVSNATATYAPKLEGMKGVVVAMVPSKLTIAPGETKVVSFNFKRGSADLQVYSTGRLTLTDGKHNVRIAVVAQPVALAAPVEASGSFPVKYGVSTNTLKVSALGLVPAVKSARTVAQSAVVDIPVTIPAGTSFVRFSLFDSDVNVPDTDLDLEIYYDGQLVGGSGGFTAQEQVDFTNPPAGTYTVRVVGYYTPGGSVAFNLYSWALGSAATGNMTASFNGPIVSGNTGTVTLATSGLTPGNKYLGSVVYSGVPSVPAPTIVRIDP
jgi:hypothetical protein